MKKIICLGLLLTMVLSSMGASCFAVFEGCKGGNVKKSRSLNDSTQSLKNQNGYTQRSKNQNGDTQLLKNQIASSNILKRVNDSSELSKSVKNPNDLAKSKKKIQQVNQENKNISVSDLKYVEYQKKNNDLDQLKENRKQVLEELKCDRDQCYKVNKCDDQKMLEEKQKEFTNLKCKKEIMDKKLAIQNLENRKKYLKDLETLSKEVENKRKEITDKIKEIEDAKKKNANDQKECKQNIIKALYRDYKKKLTLVQEEDLLNTLKRNRERSRAELIELYHRQRSEQKQLRNNFNKRFNKLDGSGIWQ